MNNTQVIGRITRDIDLSHTQSGHPVVNFTLAVNRIKKEDGIDFFNCVAWGITAENMCKYLHQGDEIGISGHLASSTYEKDGHKVYSTQIVADRVEFLRKKAGEKADAPRDNFAPVSDDDELPF